MSLSKFIKNAKAVIVKKLALYTVVNYTTGGVHYCFTVKDVMEWLACYDADAFSATFVYGFNNQLLSVKRKY